ncbi:MAG: hypothetical protein J07HX64_02114 [halophilic archaeon J07HX64]|nr:MAG: hypothetical protein J07HX64_02114 [halophilic archaeon J07HX64]
MAPVSRRGDPGLVLTAIALITWVVARAPSWQVFDLGGLATLGGTLTVVAA